MYDHLVELVRKVVEERGAKPDADTILKEFSRDAKKSTFVPEGDTIQEREAVSKPCELAHQQKQLFKDTGVKKIPTLVQQSTDDEEMESQLGLAVPDVMENAYFYELAGVGIGREETFRMFLALKQLSEELRLKSCRFWGKMFGVQRNYYIAEVEFHLNDDPHWKDGEEDDLGEEDAETAYESFVPPVLSADDVEGEDAMDVPFPQSMYKPPVVVPKESYGEGCNSKVYYVCNNAGLPWRRLPPVTPKQIQCARVIRKFMTGDLDADVVSYPPFPGNEANYLRAQIARITAATQVSPQGWYIFEEEEEEEEEEARTAIVPDVEYEPIPVSDLCDPSLTFWVHHNVYILPQGRTSWVDPNASPGGGEGEAEEAEESEDEREEPEDEEPEEGPPLLTPLSEDEPVNGQPAWTAVKSTSHFTQYAVAALHSNAWPGAHAFAFEKKFENIYIGYGLKYGADNFNPQMPPALQEEYPSGPDITEADDPTVEQERAVLAARKEAEEEEEEADESEDYDEGDEEEEEEEEE